MIVASQIYNCTINRTVSLGLDEVEAVGAYEPSTSRHSASLVVKRRFSVYAKVTRLSVFAGKI